MPQFHSKIKPLLSPAAAPKDNVTQILNQLCNKIGLKTWESDMLISKCLEKNCVDQLFSFLDQYFVHVKRLKILVKNYLELSNKLKLWNELLVQDLYEDDDGNTFSDYIGQVALCIAKLMYTMCSLRLYQESPRPLRYSIEQTNMNETVLDGNIIVLDVLRQDSNKVAKILRSGRNILQYALYNIPLQHMALVLLGNFDSVFLDHAPSATASDTSRLVSAIAGFLSVEDRIDSTWWSVRMMNLSNAVTSSTQSTFSASPRSFSFKGSSINLSKASFGFKSTKTASVTVTESDPYDLYPMLRLPYTDESRLPLDILSWFVGASECYLSLKDHIVKEMHNGSLSKYKNSSPSKESKPAVVVESPVPQQQSPKVSRHVTISPLVNVASSAPSPSFSVSNSAPSPSFSVSNSAPLLSTVKPSKEVVDTPVPVQTRVKPVNKIVTASVQGHGSPYDHMPRTAPTLSSPSPSPKSPDRHHNSRQSPTSPKSRPASSENHSRSRGGESKQQKPVAKPAVKPTSENMQPLKDVTEILDEVIESAVLQGIVNARVKSKWIKEVSRCKRLYMRELAAIRIQRLYRRYFWKKIFIFARQKLADKKKKESDEQHIRMQQHISQRLSMLHGRQLMRYENSLQTLRKLVREYVANKKRKRSALNIQRFYRGYFVRNRTLKEVISALKLIRVFRQRASLNTLKLKLQRSERTISIKMKSLNRIPAAVCASGEDISYRISIWWTPLLHILSSDDAEIFTQHNNPQAVITSVAGAYELTTPPKGDEDKSQSRQNRRHSSLRKSFKFIQEVAGNANMDLAMASQRNYCSFGDEEYVVPSCHGNTVIKIDFFFGVKRFASSKFTLREEIKKDGLLFWGGDYERPVQLITHRHNNIYSQPDSPSSHSRSRKRSPIPVQPGGSGKEDRPLVPLIASHKAPLAPRRPTINKESETMFAFSVMAGPPCRSKSSSAKFRLNGKKNYVYRSFLHYNVIGTMFGHWEKAFLLLNHNGLNFHRSRKDFTSVCTIPCDSFASVETVVGVSTKVEDSMLGGNATPVKNKIVLYEDNMDVILKVVNGEEIVMRFADLRTRCSWVETLTNVINHELKLKEIRSRNKEMSRVSQVISYLSSSISTNRLPSFRNRASVTNHDVKYEEGIREVELEEDDSDDSEY